MNSLKKTERDFIKNFLQRMNEMDFVEQMPTIWCSSELIYDVFLFRTAQRSFEIYKGLKRGQ